MLKQQCIDTVIKNEESLYNLLSSIELNSIVSSWSELMRASDELLEIGRSSHYRDKLLNLTDSENILQKVSEEYDHDTGLRIKELIDQTRVAVDNFPFLYLMFQFSTFGEIMQFYQKIRRHITIIYYLLPKFSQGTTQVDYNTLFGSKYFTRLISFSIAIRSNFDLSVVATIITDFEINDFRTNYNYEHLEEYALEPSRSNFSVEIKHAEVTLPQFATSQSLHSFDELIYLYNNLAFVYRKHKLFNTNEYRNLETFVKETRKYCIDSYTISIPQADFATLQRLLPNSLRETLVLESPNYYMAARAYASFVKVNDIYRSTISLMIRYVYNAIFERLNKSKRYQIRAGFQFEKLVKERLVSFGFQILKTKRIKRAEFDVLAKKNDIIFNFQCKNNAIDINVNNINVLAKRHVSLSNSYQRALDKERRREQAIKSKFGNLQVEEFVISRFPVITDNYRIIPFNRLLKWTQYYIENQVIPQKNINRFS